MSDPFERLRASGPGPGPDVDAIKSRARRIERRRYVGLGGGAVAIVMLAVVGIVLSTGPGDSAKQLATSADATPTAGAESAATRPRVANSLPLAPADSAAGGFVGTTSAPGAVTESTGGGASQSAPQGGESAAATRSADAASGFDVTLQVSSMTHGARFTLRACNTTSETRELTFASGQRYDFEVSRDGELVWRWSDGKAFTQVYGTEAWGPGQCKTYIDSWDGRNSQGGIAPPGSYKAVGILASSPELRSAPKSFCLDAC